MVRPVSPMREDTPDTRRSPPSPRPPASDLKRAPRETARAPPRSRVALTSPSPPPRPGHPPPVRAPPDLAQASRQNADPEEEGWEKTDFPVVCEDCLGPNPYIRMQRQDYAAECAISGRPFTVFRWRPGTEARYKKTVVCKEIALAKNVCQVCLLDLDYGIPVQARDAALGREAANNETALMGAKSDVNIEYQTEQIARRIANGEDVAAEASGVAGGALVAGGAGGKARAHEILSRMARKKPYYNKNKTAICTFWLRNACTRADCPYRPCNGDTHMPELTSAPEMRTQNIKDRYYGVNDPVAEKMLKRDEERDAAAKKAMAPPEDATITTLYVGGIDERVTEETLRDHFYAFGKLKSVRVMHAKKCAFVTFDDRAGAEAAAAAGHEARVAGLRCRVMWGKPSAAKRKNLPAGNAPGGPQQAPAGSAQKAHQQASNPGAFDPASMPLPFAPPAGKDARAAYPSTDPRALGSCGAEKE